MYNLPLTADYNIPVGQFGWIGKRVIEQCDEVDGVKDGIVSYPEQCVFNFSKIRCPLPQKKSPTCLTDPQIETAKKIYSDYHEADGKFLYTGVTLSSEDQWYILLGADVPSPFGVQYIQDFLLNDPNWDWKTYSDNLTHLAEKLDPARRRRRSTTSTHSGTAAARSSYTTASRTGWCPRAGRRSITTRRSRPWATLTAGFATSRSPACSTAGTRR